MQFEPEITGTSRAAAHTASPEQPGIHISRQDEGSAVGLGSTSDAAPAQAAVGTGAGCGGSASGGPGEGTSASASDAEHLVADGVGDALIWNPRYPPHLGPALL